MGMLEGLANVFLLILYLEFLSLLDALLEVAGEEGVLDVEELVHVAHGEGLQGDVGESGAVVSDLQLRLALLSSSSLS